MRLSVPRKQPLAEAAAKESQGDMGPFQDGSQTRPHHLLGSGFGDVKDAKMRDWVMDSFREPLRPGSG